jgi:hypothetical protein
MALIGNAINGVRMAGSALGAYLGNPATYEQLGKKVALETALGTAVQQAVPRLLGQPAPGLRQSIGNTALHSAFAHPITGSMEAIGAPGWAANMTGAVVGGTGANLVSQAVSRSITEPEPAEAPHPHLSQLMELQRMEAAAEQQRYNNQINYAYAKNYRDPAVIIHKNPSAEMETAYRILTHSPAYRV